MNRSIFVKQNKSFWGHFEDFLDPPGALHIVPRIANCGKKVYIYTLECHIEVNETILKMPYIQ